MAVATQRENEKGREAGELGHQRTKGEWSLRRGDRVGEFKTVTVRTKMWPLRAAVKLQQESVSVSVCRLNS